ncbi:hypothetical protein [Endozoicomonas sp. SCSIO W0465]|uniref:hypothetical protein n=1 Tax=Endozoicomonas sp. SCSIO W0465 TaxID=2918516 RepID=UPI002076053C|nr:hypothetical protein [Endozoicomonas sp. SCSIO W0465]USE34412.1 hypothetical protein MJO57_19960 [Endozoicomonas sp. SCSIO W0465]
MQKLAKTHLPNPVNKEKSEALIGLQTVPRLNLAEALIIKGSQSFARQFALKPYIAWSTSNFHCRAVRKSNRAKSDIPEVNFQEI